MKMRVRIRDLALVAVASGLLAFEVTSLKGALPGMGSATSHAAVGALKGAVRLLGTVTPPVSARGLVLLASRGESRGMVGRVHVLTLSREACRELAASGLSTRRMRQICRELETARRHSTL